MCLEKEYSEEHYLVGEALFDNEAIVKAVKSKGNIWNITISDDENYEIQVRGYGTKRQKQTCCCPGYKVEKSCPHIITALLHIRKLSTPTSEISKIKQKKTRAFNINTILEELNRDDLVKFIKLNAKKDKAFNFMFKTVFASRVEIDDNGEKYSKILHPLIKPVTVLGKKSSTADTRLAIRIIHEFIDQLEDAFTLEHYTVVLDIMKGIWNKVHYLYRHYPASQKYLEQTILKLNSLIPRLYQSDLSPQLLHKLDNLLIALSAMSYYNFIDKNNEVIFHLFNSRRSKALIEVKELLMDNGLLKIIDDELPLAAALYILLGMEDTVGRSLNDVKIIETAKILTNWKFFDKSISIISNIMDPTKRNRSLEYALIDSYYKASMIPEGESLAIYYLIKYKEFRFLRKIKEENDGLIVKRIEKKINNELKKLEGEFQFKSTYYRMIADVDNLLAVLDKSLSLRLLMEHDRFLYAKAYNQLEKIYLKSISNYLSTHVGNVATNYLEEVMAHLSNINATKLYQTIKTLLDTSYSHRILPTSFK